MHHWQTQKRRKLALLGLVALLFGLVTYFVGSLYRSNALREETTKANANRLFTMVQATFAIRQGNREGPLVTGARIALLYLRPGRADSQVLASSVSREPGTTQLNVSLDQTRNEDVEYQLRLNYKGVTRQWDLQDFPTVQDWVVVADEVKSPKPSPDFEAMMRRPGKLEVPALIVGLKCDEQYLRIWAAYELGKMGSDAKAAMPALEVATKDPDKVFRATAIYSLGRIGSATEEDIPVHHTFYREAEDQITQELSGYAREALWQRRTGRMPASGSASPTRLEALLGMLKATDEVVLPVFAGSTLGLMGSPLGPRAFLAASALIPGRTVKAVQREGLHALRRMGTATKEIAPALVEAVKDEDEGVRLHIARVLVESASKNTAVVSPLRGRAKIT